MNEFNKSLTILTEKYGVYFEQDSDYWPVTGGLNVLKDDGKFWFAVNNVINNQDRAPEFIERCIIDELESEKLAAV